MKIMQTNWDKKLAPFYFGDHKDWVQCKMQA